MTAVTPDEIALAMSRWDEAIEAIKKLTEAHARKVRILVVLFVLDIALTVGVGWNTVQSRHAQAVAAHTTCLVGNQFRAHDKQLWYHVLGLAQHPTPSQSATEAQFRVYINQLDAPRQC